MMLGKAIAISLMVHHIILTAILATNFLGEEFHVVPTLMPNDVPEVFRICPERQLEGDTLWAVKEWNKALETYKIPVKLEVASDDCTVRIRPTEAPLGGEYGGKMELVPREGVNITVVRPGEPYNVFSKFEFMVSVWTAHDDRLRRGILLHELGHSILLISHIHDYLGPGPKPIMVAELDPADPTTHVTSADAIFAWVVHVYCSQNECFTFLNGAAYPTPIKVRIPNFVLASTVAVSVSAVIAVALAVKGCGWKSETG